MITEEALLEAGIIFFLRVLNNGIGTIRLISLSRQQRLLTITLGFFETLIFAVTISGVVTDLTNVLNLLAYCGGFSVGTYLGMLIEARFITSFMSVNVISATHGHDIAVALREHGFGVTETVGEGLNGKVIMLHSVVNRRDMPRVVQTINAKHPEAFVSIGEARSVHHGWVRGVRNQPTP
ncbi:MAG TPA: DUF5698 domain-containing protein [Oceanobacillus sp.]|nr:DUF5698 domain-containing protein [Oceanobacillus sp.]